MLASWLGKKPALAYTDPDGYQYDETDEWWKVACEPLPCFEALAWPGYGTAIIEDVIDGNPNYGGRQPRSSPTSSGN